MRILWIILGRILYYVSYPILAWYLSSTERTRVIILRGDEVLLVRSWAGNGDWDLPGGGIHDGEQPVKAAVRELHEELSIVADPESLQHAETADFSKGWIHYKAHYFALHLPEKPVLRLQASEIVAAQWVDIGKLDEYRLPDAYREYIQRLAAS